MKIAFERVGQALNVWALWDGMSDEAALTAAYDTLLEQLNA